MSERLMFSSSVSEQADPLALPETTTYKRRKRLRLRRKGFAARTAGEARTAAGAWLNDFNRHGPLDIQNISTRRLPDRFLTVVSYVR